MWLVTAHPYLVLPEGRLDDHGVHVLALLGLLATLSGLATLAGLVLLARSLTAHPSPAAGQKAKAKTWRIYQKRGVHSATTLETSSRHGAQSSRSRRDRGYARPVVRRTRQKEFVFLWTNQRKKKSYKYIIVDCCTPNYCCGHASKTSNIN